MSSIFTQVPIKTIVKKFRGGATVIGVQDTDKVLLNLFRMIWHWGLIIFFKVTDAYQKITTHNILSVPVLDTQTQRYSQFIDIIDILCFILSVSNRRLFMKIFAIAQACL